MSRVPHELHPAPSRKSKLILPLTGNTKKSSRKDRKGTKFKNTVKRLSRDASLERSRMRSAKTRSPGPSEEDAMCLRAKSTTVLAHGAKSLWGRFLLHLGTLSASFGRPLDPRIRPLSEKTEQKHWNEQRRTNPRIVRKLRLTTNPQTTRWICFSRLSLLRLP